MPLDTLRWWLLYPGRMEFMMWISGALLLLCVTCTLLFAMLASSGVIHFSNVNVANTASVNTPIATTKSAGVATHTTTVTPTTATTPTAPTSKPMTSTTGQATTQTQSLSGTTTRQATSSNTWIWAVVAGYTLSLVLLGFAVLLYRRKRRIS
jgi:hypothetical protein